MEQTPIPRWQTVTGWVLSGILAFLFLPSAFFKIAQPTGFLDEWSKTYPASSALPIGVIEVTLFVLYLVPNTRYLGGLLMLAYLGGAVATHLHAGDLRRPGRRTGRACRLPPLARRLVPSGLGRLRQAAVRRCRAGFSLPGPLLA